jgi:hypothetical protein
MNTQSSSAYLDHDEIWLLIPWYANGSLSGSEHDRVKAHVQVCLMCRREFSYQLMLAKQLEHTPRMEISSKPSFERLMSRINEEDSPQTEPMIKPRTKRREQRQGNPQGLARLKGLLIYFTPPKHLAAAFATALLAIAIVLQFGGIPTYGIKDYHTVANPHELDRFSTQDLRVVFADQVTDQEISALIGSIQGRKLDGPNRVGAITIRIPDSMTADQALSQLRDSKLVIFAEPALPQSGKPNGGGG